MISSKIQSVYHTIKQTKKGLQNTKQFKHQCTKKHNMMQLKTQNIVIIENKQTNKEQTAQENIK